MTTPLKTWMIPRAAELIEKKEISPSDVALEQFDKWKDEIPNNGIIDDMNAPLMAARCAELVDVALVYSQVCDAFSKACRTRRKSAKAIAFLERSVLYLSDENRKIKVTDESKKAYVDIDPGAIKCQDMEDSWQTLANYFEELHDDYRDRHIWYRKIMEAKNNEMKTVRQQ